MGLPIVTVEHQPQAQDLMRLFRRADQRWAEHLADPVQLEAGIAFANASLPDIHMANHVRDFAVRRHSSVEGAIAEVDAFFAQAGTRCWHWLLSEEAPPQERAALGEALTARGCRVGTEEVYYLRKAQTPPAAIRSDLKVIPARASYRHVREMSQREVEEEYGHQPNLVEAHLAHLDDPHYDAMVALAGTQAVGGAGVLIVGELGLIERVYVMPENRRTGVGRLLVSRALEICARSLLKHVFLAVNPQNTGAIELYRSFGFERLGRPTAWLAPGI